MTNVKELKGNIDSLLSTVSRLLRSLMVSSAKWATTADAEPFPELAESTLLKVMDCVFFFLSDYFVVALYVKCHGMMLSHVADDF